MRRAAREVNTGEMVVAVLKLLSTTPRRRMGEWMYRSTILILALDGDEWSASRPRALPLEKEPQYRLDRV
jgi:hypothetical protein